MISESHEINLTQAGRTGCTPSNACRQGVLKSCPQNNISTTMGKRRGPASTAYTSRTMDAKKQKRQ
ncbi:unnamed protein product [Acanthoscelides obtectus]|uniref:Uncharacterized protein n=1 Tax=Acanthoscelides obtectus TaxID=200917 RepID=A0A9P0VV57_ACAOB|nr:unnamed protein product [Acanthoscelides obtectus]CAK1684675.1 hypothetical protein AOBTE_LOCUS35021 [Acanthoscelides obtectus]